MSTPDGKHSKSSSSLGMILLLGASVFAASANTVLFKITLNSFSSPTTNYGFFVSQASTLVYVLQAMSVSAVLLWRRPTETKDLSSTRQPIYMYMGTLDGASATLAAIAGANCPGALQTILNQTIIPITMLSAFFFLSSVFDGHQMAGAGLIFCGSCLASSDYFFSAHSAAHSNGTSILIYCFSVIPSALSNIYKETKMKEEDMNEVHVSTMVSMYQLVIGFLFLPLMALPQLGGLDYDEMKSQLSDGFTCFYDGVNPHDPHDQGCRSAKWLFIIYVVLNFVYNVMMLSITKNGSAVLLVTSQALSLPITNIAFTLQALMGADAEPLSMLDLAGLVLVCIGFLAYSGFGFAQNFMVAQGPPGQMAYAHFEDQSEIVVNTAVVTDPNELISFLVGAVMEAHRLREEKLGRMPLPDISYSELELAENNRRPSEASALVQGGISSSASNSPDFGTTRRRSSASRSGVAIPLTQLEASEAAMKVLRNATDMLQYKINQLKRGEQDVQVMMSPLMVRHRAKKKRNAEDGRERSDSEAGSVGYYGSSSVRTFD